MIELSLGKMVLLALIALIVLGPEKLPGAARTAGALLRRLRSGWDNVRAEVERELEIEEIKRSAREAVATAEAAQQQVKDTLKSAHDPFAEAAAMVRLKPPVSSDQLPIPEEKAPEQRTTNPPLLDLPLETVSSTGHLNPADPPSAQIGAPALPSTDRAAPDPVTDGRALEGVQSELPLDEPPMNVAQHEPAHDMTRHDNDQPDSDSHEKGSPHGNA